MFIFCTRMDLSIPWIYKVLYFTKTQSWIALIWRTYIHICSPHPFPRISSLIAPYFMWYLANSEVQLQYVQTFIVRESELQWKSQKMGSLFQNWVFMLSLVTSVQNTCIGLLASTVLCSYVVQCNCSVLLLWI